jgi:pumilio homology domain family member 6
MVKSLKEIILDMSTDQHAHTVLLTLLAVIDDTKLVSKALQSEVHGHWSDIIWHKWGRRIVLFLCREDKDPLIKEVRDKSAATSKKDVAVRRGELLDSFGGALLGVVEGEGDRMMRDPQASQVVQEILLFTKESGDGKSRAVDTIVSLGSGDPSDEEHIIRVPFTARIYKTLVQGGHYNPKEKTVEGTPSSGGWTDVQWLIQNSNSRASFIMPSGRISRNGPWGTARLSLSLCWKLFRGRKRRD